MNTRNLQIAGGSPGGRVFSRLAGVVKVWSASRAGTPACRKKILLVDDDPVILKSACMKLTAEGYDVVCASDASGAIGSVRDEEPDVILLDLSFPPDVANGGTLDWDGVRIMSWLRGLEECNGVPFIIMTGGDAARYRELCLARGAIGFFEKPINYAALVRLLSETLGTTGPPKKPDMDPRPVG